MVTPRVLSQSDIANAFVKLLEPAEAQDPKFNALHFLASSLGKSTTGKPFLFVFDNFETVRNPADLFAWLDIHIRLPNKVLITTRHREFKADFPIDVPGMTEGEVEKLIDSTARRLNIVDLLTSRYKNEIYEEADGHPYIIKVLLGEVAKARKLVKVERIVANKEDILDALFERTYAGLQPVAKRVFLTLCSWRSLVPQVALEAVLLRPSNEKMDVEAAIEELVASSFIDQTAAEDGTIFLDVALAASVFGRKKLEITPMKTAIDADVNFLQQIGATSASALRHGVKPRIESLFQSIATRVAMGRLELTTMIPSLEFICRQYPPAWLMLAKLHEESCGRDGSFDAAECLRRFLELHQTLDDQRTAWDELSRIYKSNGDWTGAAQASIRACKIPGTTYETLSNTANWLNNLLRENYVAMDSEEKQFLYRDLCRLMESRSSEANATDFSRLAWLHLHMRDVPKAIENAKKRPGSRSTKRTLSETRYQAT